MIFAKELGQTEGPVLLDDGGWLICQMSPENGCVSRIDKDGGNLDVLARTGRPNGLAVDRNGVIWVAETKPPGLIRLTMDKESEIVFTECDGEPLLFPNDLCFGPDGALYLTDSGILFDDFVPGGEIRPDYLTCPVDGRVYRIDTEARTITKLMSGGRFTNGIAFGPDGAMYLCETLTGEILRYQVVNGKLENREVFGQTLKKAPEDYEMIAGPDGMAFGTDGNLYIAVTGQQDITVLGPDGNVVTRMPTETPFPTNCAFGPPGSGKLVVTEMAMGAMEVLDVSTDGFTLYT